MNVRYYTVSSIYPVILYEPGGDASLIRIRRKLDLTHLLAFLSVLFCLRSEVIPALRSSLWLPQWNKLHRTNRRDNQGREWHCDHRNPPTQLTLWPWKGFAQCSRCGTRGVVWVCPAAERGRPGFWGEASWRPRGWPEWQIGLLLLQRSFYLSSEWYQPKSFWRELLQSEI